MIWILSNVVFAVFDEQLTAEKNLQNKAQHILDTMFGKHKFSVIAKVKISSESWSVKYTELAKVKIEKKNKKSYEILPGFTAIKICPRIK